MAGDTARERLRDLARRVRPLRLGALHSATVDELSEDLAEAAARPPSKRNAAAALRAGERLRAALLEAVEDGGPRAVDELAHGEPSRAVARKLLCYAGAKEMCARRGERKRRASGRRDKTTAPFHDKRDKRH